MGIIFKTFLTILSLGVLGLLIITSFIINQYSTSEENNLLLSFETNIDTLTGSTKYKSLSDLDEVFYSTGKIDYSTEGNTTIINLLPGEYIFSLSGIGSEYNINYKGFSLKNVGPGTFYINTIDENKYSIFSLSSVLYLTLIDIKDNSSLTNIHIYPHGYILFDPEKNDKVRGADVLRISSVVLGLGYLNKNILDISGGVNTEFIKDIRGLLDNENFLLSVLNVIYQNNKKFYSKLGELRKEDKTFISGAKYVERYDWLFLNEKKKDSFYKSVIFNDLDTLFVSTKKDNKLVNKIYNNYVKLDGRQDKTIQSVLNNYYRYVSLENNNYSKYNFYNLYHKLSQNKVNFIPSLFYFRDIYNNYDFIGSNNLYSDITVFNKQYFNDLGISIGKNKLVIDDSNYLTLDYFSFFLQQLLLEHNTFDKETISKVIAIFDYYVLLDDNLYGSKTSTKITTGIKNHLDVLDNISKSIRGYYFENNRGDFDLLLKKKIEISPNNIEKLQKNINNLIDFFNDNKHILNENDTKIDSYKIIKEDMDEYFIALLDYERYKSVYTSKFRKDNNSSSLFLTKEKALNILNYFENVSTNNTEINIVDDQYYSISNLNFDGRTLGFKLYPYNNNLIDEIFIDGTSIEWGYDLGEKIENNGAVLPSVGENFFEEIFSYNLDPEGPDIYNPKYEPDPIEYLVYKRDELLGDYGEFFNLRGILTIVVENITVKNKRTEHIYLTDLLLTINSDKEVDEKKISYNALLSSDYHMKEKDSYFENIILKVIDGNEKADEKEYLLFGNEIKIKGKINNKDFEKEMVEFSFALYDLLIIGKNINNILGKDSFDIEYSLLRNKLTIKFSYLKEAVLISWVKGKIDFISYKGKNILDSKIELDKLEENLFNLK